MGLSGSSTKTTTKPVYSSQIEGAANNVTNAYNAQQPKITSITDQLGSLVPGLIDQYKNGNPTANAANGYAQDVLGGKYLDAGNPYLDQMISKSNNDVQNTNAAALGTRGLTGGSAFSDIIARAVADNGTKLRYNDYSTERDRMGQMAGLAPSLAATDYLPISAIQSIAQSQQMPVQSAAGAGSAVGGLLGQYTNGTQTQSMGLGQLIASLGGGALSGWASGGFK